MKQTIIAISGVKNSGKTTLITKIIPKLCEKGYKVATIKHDGHDFDDVFDTDTYKHRKSGASGVAIYSKNKFMLIKEQENTLETDLLEHFRDFDIIILEGFKYSNYKKIEIVRKENSDNFVGNQSTFLAVATDIEELIDEKMYFDLNNIEKITEIILNYAKEGNKC